MNGRKIVVVLLGISLLLGTVSCSQAEPKKEKVTIYLRNYADHMGVFSADEPNADYDSMTEYMAEKFVRQYDKYDVEIKTEYFALEDEPKFVEEKYGQPDATDVVLQDAFVNLGHIYEGRLIPLDDVVPDSIRTSMGPEFERLYQIGGKCYNLPYGRLPTVFLYNAELFRKAGLDEYIADQNEISDWSVDEWNEILAGLKENLPPNIYPMMMYGADTNGDMVNMMLLRMYGNSFFDENGNCCLDDENGIRALQWIKDNQDKGYYPVGAENIGLMDCFELYCNDQLAIYFGNNVILPMITNPDVDSRYALYPSSEGKGMSFDFTYTFGVFDNGDKKRMEVSKDFLRFVYSDEELLSLCSYAGELPAVSSEASQYTKDIPMWEQWLDIQDTRVDFTNHSPNYPGIREVFYPEITSMLSGDKTPEETAQDLEEKINLALERGRVEGTLHE